jgi:L-fuconolactonase
LYGSDWPVCLLAGDYGSGYRAVREILAPSLTSEREAKLFGENASRFYRLKA